MLEPGEGVVTERRGKGGGDGGGGGASERGEGVMGSKHSACQVTQYLGFSLCENESPVYLSRTTLIVRVCVFLDHILRFI